MSVLDRLQAASYKGVPFLVPQETESAGKKVTVHEFPGSNKRFVEELGELLPTFRLTLVIHGRTVDQQRIGLSNALKSAGPGILVHPYLGRVRCSAVDWSIDTGDRNVGEVIFDVTFVQTDVDLSLNRAVGGINAVFSSAELARQRIDEAFGDRYLPVRITASIKEIGARTRESIGLVQAAVAGATNPVADTLNALNSEVSQTREAVFSVVRTPQQIANAFRGVFRTALSIAETPADLANEWKLATEFGSPPRFLASGQVSRTFGTVRDVIKPTTGERALKGTNLRLIDQRVRIEALVNWMEAEADRDFDTVDDLVATRADIDAAFTRIVIDQDDSLITSELGDDILTDANIIFLGDATQDAIALDRSLALDPDLRDALADLRAAVMETLSLSNKNPFQVEDVDIGFTDAQLATYQLFGSLELLSDIQSLNADRNLAGIAEPVRAISQ